MNIFSLLFPVNLYLNIFQLEEYNIFRFSKWVFTNIFVRTVPQKRKIVPTLKIRLLFALSIVFICFLFIALSIKTNNLFFSLVITFLFSTQFYLPLIISRIILYPFELLIIQKNINNTNQKIKSLRNLKVISIAGSYGKTSVKEILYQLIKDKYKTLRTPESYNTILGISKVVDLELDNTYQYFICEMAAYQGQDIRKLCKMVPPDYAILTGITSQHLERFGSLEKIIKAKFELYEAILNKKNILLNLGDKNVLSEIKRRNIDSPQGYLEVSNLVFSKFGSNFELGYNGNKYPIQTNLFGISNIVNLAGAITMALKLGLKIDYLLDKTKDLMPVANRFVLKHFDKTSIVDNTFSSNEESFKEMVDTAKMVKGKKVLITPGLVELGTDEELINKKVASLTDSVFDKIILVGKNKRTLAFNESLKVKAEFIEDTQEKYFNKIDDLKLKYDWIFLENDITQNYN